MNKLVPMTYLVLVVKGPEIIIMIFLSIYLTVYLKSLSS